MQSRLITEVAFSLLGSAHGMHAPACIAGASNPLHVVANERLPGLQWAIPPRHHVDRNHGLRDLDAQLEQFAMDLGRAAPPQRVLEAHASDQVAHRRGDPLPPRGRDFHRQ